MSVTLTSLILQVRQRANMEGSGFIDDTVELPAYINASAAELYDVLVSRFEDYYSTSLPVTIATGNTAPLPADFYKLVGLDLFVGGYTVTVHPFNFIERNKFNRPIQRPRFSPVRYRIMGQNLLLTPPDLAPGSYTIWYVPRFTNLVLGTDTLDTLQNWTDYVVVDAAIKCLVKEESDVSVLLMEKAALLKRIESMAANRDAGEPLTVSDVSGDWGNY